MNLHNTRHYKFPEPFGVLHGGLQALREGGRGRVEVHRGRLPEGNGGIRGRLGKGDFPLKVSHFILFLHTLNTLSSLAQSRQYTDYTPYCSTVDQCPEQFNVLLSWHWQSCVSFLLLFNFNSVSHIILSFCFVNPYYFKTRSRKGSS